MATLEKSRYFAFGCSYTNYYWPTYADYLSSCFDEYINLGAAGAGNRYIFQKLLNLVNYQELLSRPLGKNDLITIQWSGLPREDKILPKENSTRYVTSGHLGSQGTFPEHYVTNYFSLIQSAFELTAYITAAKHLLESLGVEYKMFFMMEPDEEDFLGEVFLTPSQTNLGIFNEDTITLVDTGMLDKITSLLPQDILSVEKFRLLNTIDDEKLYHLTFIEENGETSLQEDSHPTPYTHLEYAKYLSQNLTLCDSSLLLQDWSKDITYMDEYYSQEGRTKALQEGDPDFNNISSEYYPKTKSETTKLDGDVILNSTCINSLLQHTKTIFNPSSRKKLTFI